MPKLFALVDCNNFYVSCERIFRPQLKYHPVAVLSNNDGCFISRSREVKELGIPMGEPLFKCTHLVKQHDVKLFSSNFSFYGDISSRIMMILRGIYGESLEVYSVDEAFIEFKPQALANNLKEEFINLRKYIYRCVGIPVSIGIGETKTLAKLANVLAKTDKSYHGVSCLWMNPYQEKLLKNFRVSDLWGIGRGYAKFCKRHYISTAYDLASADIHWLRQQLGVQGARIALELKGVPCIPLEKEEKFPRTIISSRSFGYTVRSKEELKQALSNFTELACRKLRNKKAWASYVVIFLRYLGEARRIQKLSIAKHLLEASSYTPDFLEAVTELLDQVYISGLDYKKAGLMLGDIVPEGVKQLNLFKSKPGKEEQNTSNLISLYDHLNSKYGQGKLFYASQGNKSKKSNWQANQSFRSPCFTTRWEDLYQIS